MDATQKKNRDAKLHKARRGTKIQHFCAMLSFLGTECGRTVQDQGENHKEKLQREEGGNKGVSKFQNSDKMLTLC